MTDRVIPLTPPGPLWSQREYVAAMRCDIGFTAHLRSDGRQWFHYAFPDDVGCTSVLISGVGDVLRYVDHKFHRNPDWIKQAAAAVRDAKS